MIKGYKSSVTVNEFSKYSNINENYKDQVSHIIWNCSGCDELNIEFEFSQSPQTFMCENCKKKEQVKWE